MADRKPRPPLSLAATLEPLSWHPLTVRCPTCCHPIRLADWWVHDCERAITEHGPALGDWYTIIGGQRA